MPDPEDPNERVSALRLRFWYEGERVGLESREEVEMTPIASDSDVAEDREGPPRAQIGVRYEVVDGAGGVLYQRVARDLIPESIEIPTTVQERPFSRQGIPEHRGTFDVIVPLVEGAQDFVLYRSPSEELIRRGEAEPLFHEVLRVSLTSPD